MQDIASTSLKESFTLGPLSLEDCPIVMGLQA